MTAAVSVASSESTTTQKTQPASLYSEAISLLSGRVSASLASMPKVLCSLIAEYLVENIQIPRFTTSAHSPCRYVSVVTGAKIVFPNDGEIGLVEDNNSGYHYRSSSEYYPKLQARFDELYAQQEKTVQENEDMHQELCVDYLSEQWKPGNKIQMPLISQTPLNAALKASVIFLMIYGSENSIVIYFLQERYISTAEQWNEQRCQSKLDALWQSAFEPSK